VSRAAGRIAGPEAVGEAVELLRAGRLVAFPTETVYGLGADAANPDALARLYAVKGRPADHPVIVHVDGPGRLDDVAVGVPEAARRLAAACWPGPLTLVVRRNPAAVSGRATGGRDTVGVRVPDHPLALELLRRFGGGVAAPSANRFGRVSPTRAADVAADLDGDVDLILDGGPCRVGVESTIVDCTGEEPAVLRAGGVSLERLTELLGRPPRLGGTTPAPGTLPAHYAPRARVEVVGADELAGRAAALVERHGRIGVLAPAGPALREAARRSGVVVLAAPADAEGYARTLYAALRGADRKGLPVVLAVPPAEEGIGRAVADRLRRAAAGGR
jgi:L-threonylcarbamoyladenylate synthase